jgi:hypothetical protein
MKLFIFFFIFSTLNISYVSASSLSFDVGQTETIFNSFAIPNDTANRVSLPGDDELTSYRLTGYFDLSSGNQIYFLIAPLETKYKFKSSKKFEFDNENYLAGTETEVDYKFNSYRLGYLWREQFASLILWGGVVVKIRDAKIKVSQGSKVSEFDNVGIVPLASFGFEIFLNRSISFFSHTDALAAPQGSAYDSQFGIKYQVNLLSISLGKRILGGGADNDNVYNFAQFDTFYTRIGYSF